MIIATSNLGYDVSLYKVNTDASVRELRLLDAVFGAKGRASSTHISQLEQGARIYEYKFDIEEVIIENGSWQDPKFQKPDFIAYYGNY